MSRRGGAHAAERSGPPLRKALRSLAPLVSVGSVVLIVSGIYLFPFLMDQSRLPHGFDTPGYVYRARLVHEVGLPALDNVGDRPGHPIVTSIVRDVAGGTPLDLARAAPAVFSVAVALAATGLVVEVARQRTWVAAAVGVGVGSSAFVVLTAVGYASNLLLDALAVAAVGLAVRTRDGDPGRYLLILVLAAGAIVHWIFATALLLLLAGYAVGVLLSGWTRPNRKGSQVAAARLLLILATGLILGVGALLLSPRTPSSFPSSDVDRSTKIAERLPSMELAFTMPLAGIGAAVVFLVGRPGARRIAAPLLLWACAAPAGLFAWKVLGIPFPHRVVPFALGVPALIVLGAGSGDAWLSDHLRSGGRAVRSVVGIAGVGLVLLPTFWLANGGSDTWSRQKGRLSDDQVSQGITLAAYLEDVPADVSVVVPVGPEARKPLGGLLIALPAERSRSLIAWRAEPAGHERRFLDRLSRISGGVVAVFLSSYNTGRMPEGTSLAPGVVLLTGPDPGRDLLDRASTSTSDGELIRLAAVGIVTLMVTGLGWTAALTDLRPAAAICFAPATGLAMLALAGLIVGRWDVPLGGGVGAATAGVVALLGLMAMLVRRRTHPDPSPGGEATSGPSRVPEVAGGVDTGGGDARGKGRIGLE